MEKKAKNVRKEPPNEPLHRQLAHQIRQDIRNNFKAGDKLPPESKLAEERKVSVLTVREALCVLEQEKLISRHRGRGTFVLDQKDRQHLALAMGLDILDPSISVYFRLLTSGIRARFEELGENVRIYFGRNKLTEYSTDFDCPSFFEDLAAARVKGVVAIDLVPFGEWMNKVNQQALPVVGLGSFYPFGIETDLDSMISDGVEALVREGRKRVAMIGFGSSDPEQNALIRRFTGELKSRGLVVKPEWIAVEQHQAQKTAGWKAMHKIWEASGEKPDGLFVADNMLFRDAFVAIRELNLSVPDDLLVATHAVKGDDFYYRRFVIRLEVDPSVDAKVLSDLMCARMENREIDRPRRILSHSLFLE